jgi:effector-binding domain-containing protein
MTREEGWHVAYDIEVKDLPDVTVATVREHVSMAVIAKAIGEGFGEVAEAVQAAGASITGMPFAVFHDVDPFEVDVEIGFPVDRILDVGRVHGASLPGRRVVATVHRGPYDEVVQAYEALSAWIDARGERQGGPPREVYLNEPAEGVVPLTEVQVPIA